MKHPIPQAALLALCFICTGLHAENTIELETTVIKGNKEVPQILYMVPWQETKNTTRREQHKLQLHSLFGDLFEPVVPEKHSHTGNGKY